MSRDTKNSYIYFEEYTVVYNAPCDGCSFFDYCGDNSVACLAYSKYMRDKPWKEKDRGRKMKRLEEVEGGVNALRSKQYLKTMFSQDDLL